MGQQMTVSTYVHCLSKLKIPLYIDIWSLKRSFNSIIVSVLCLLSGGGQDSHGGGLKKSSLVLTTSSGGGAVGGRGGGQATSTKVELSLPTTNASPLKEVAFCGKSQVSHTFVC